MERYLIASPAVRMELEEAELFAVAALGLLKDTISPSFLDFTCEGVLLVKGKSREEAAVQWMEEHFDSLQSACYAAGVLIEKAADILQLLPHMQEAEAGKEDAQHG